jgi:hypothetical protein
MKREGPGHSLQTTALGWWNTRGAGQTVADSTSNHNNGISYGTWSSPQQVQGQIGGSLSFNGAPGWG